MTINVLGIAGSPEIGGNTEILLDKVLDGCDSNKDDEIIKEKLVVGELNIHACTSCRSCTKTGKCKIDDDMQYVYTRLLWANRIIIASPVYFMCVTAQIKAIIDRCQMFWARKFQLHKPLTGAEQKANRKGILISTAGNNKNPDIFDGLIKTVRAVFATIDVVYDDHNSLLFTGIEDKQEILRHPNYLQTAYNVGMEFTKQY